MPLKSFGDLLDILRVSNYMEKGYFSLFKTDPLTWQKKGISKFLEGPVQYTLKQKYCNTLWPKCSYYVL